MASGTVTPARYLQPWGRGGVTNPFHRHSANRKGEFHPEEEKDFDINKESPNPSQGLASSVQALDKSGSAGPIGRERTTADNRGPAGPTADDASRRTLANSRCSHPPTSPRLVRQRPLPARQSTHPLDRLEPRGRRGLWVGVAPALSSGKSLYLFPRAGATCSSWRCPAGSSEEGASRDGAPMILP